MELNMNGGSEADSKFYSLDARYATVETRGNILDESSISSWNWRIYWKDQLLYSGSEASSAIKLSGKARYTVLAWANCTIPAAQTGNLASLLGYSHTFIDEQSSWDTPGTIPMSFLAEDISGEELDLLDGNADMAIVLPMERIMAKVNLSIEYDPLTDTMFNGGSGPNDGIRVNSILLGGMHQSVGLFRSASNQREEAENDIVIDQSSDGNPIYCFYIPESLGGNLLEGNTNPMLKDASSLQALGLEPSAYPYIEAEISFYAVHVAHNVSKTYRFYIGEDSYRNFDIRRNHCYDITLHIGYDGLDCTGEWKIDGTDLNDRRVLVLSALDHRVSPGESVVLDSYYEYNNIDNVADRFYLRANGFAVGLADDADSYLESGIHPQGFRQLSGNCYMFVCNTCGHRYTDFPKNTSERTAWRQAKLTTSGTNVLCRWCNQKFFEIGVSSPEFSNFRTSTGTWSTTVCAVETQDAAMCEYTVPAGAQSGDEVTFYAWTRDGRQISSDIISVSSGTAPSLSSSKGRKTWIAQQNIITVAQWPQGIYGADPSFTFQISCRNTSNNADAGVASLTPYTGADYPQNRSVVVNCRKSGTYTVSIKYGGTTVADAVFTGAIYAPIIGYPDDAPVNYSVTGVSVKNRGGSSSFTKPVYLRENAMGRWLAYDDYSSELFTSCLGEISSSLADNNGWVSFTDGATASVRLAHAYKNGVVSEANLVPFRNPSQRLEQIRFSSPVASSIQPCGVPVYFDTKYRNLGLVKDYPQFFIFHADEDKTFAQGSTEFDASAYYSYPFDNNEFFGEYNGSVCAWSRVISADANGHTYRFNTDETGSKRVFWELKGTSGDACRIDICRIKVIDRYIGTLFTADEKAWDRKDYIMVNGNNPGPGFEGWESENSFMYKGFCADSFTSTGYHFTVGCRNIVKGLFVIEHRNFLPTEDAYDPAPERGYASYLYQNWYHSPNNKYATFYSKAKHIYNDADLSYIPVMARYAGYYSMIPLPGLMHSFETRGFNMARYKKFNSPLFKPRPSPASADGVNWNKTSDDGTTAVWTSSDGLRICEFRYGAWDN